MGYGFWCIGEGERREKKEESLTNKAGKKKFDGEMDMKRHERRKEEGGRRKKHGRKMK